MIRKSPRKLYKKLFIIYFLIIFGIVFSLLFYFTIKIKEQRRESTLTYVEIMFERAVSYVNQAAEDSNQILVSLYQSGEELQDVLNYLQDDIEVYLKKRLDLYSASSSLSYSSIDNFVQKVMESNKKIDCISFISYEKEEKTDYYPNGRTYISNYEDASAKESVLTPKTDGLTFLKTIKHPVTLTNIGSMAIRYDSSGLLKAHTFYSQAELLVYHNSGYVIYDSGEFYGKEGAYIPGDAADLLRNPPALIRGVKRKKNKYINYESIGDFNIAAIMDADKADNMPYFLWVTIYGIGVSLLIIGVVLVHLHLSRLTKRLGGILHGMDRVTKGDLSHRLITGKEMDELGVISHHYNEMCAELNTYIEKSYLMEIEQKNAEMSALQSQINPHFLYNTLEAIRMKAICEGDKEVGKMLYNLAVIFRSQVKEHNIVTVAKELHYCKKYLELFQFRHKDKFDFEIVCDSEWLQLPIIKFIIQPVVENYFIHGIRLDEKDNYIKIQADVKDGDLWIHIIDNGKGMSDISLDKKNLELKSLTKSPSGTIGLMNVQNRLRTEYGQDYGIHLQKNQGRGLCVALKLKGKEICHV